MEGFLPEAAGGFLGAVEGFLGADEVSWEPWGFFHRDRRWTSNSLHRLSRVVNPGNRMVVEVSTVSF